MVDSGRQLRLPPFSYELIEMRIFVWALRLCIFLIFVALAVRNLEPASLVLFAEYSVQAPLVIMLLGAFLVGVILTALSFALLLLRQQREILHLSAELHTAQASLDKVTPTSQHNGLLPPIA